MLRRLAVHASGLYRAAYREGAYYTTAASKGADSESVDYRVELQHLRYPRRVGDLVRSSLGNPMMMKYLTKLTLGTYPPGGGGGGSFCSDLLYSRP